MKIGLYNPYYDGLGGGERYTLTLASHWSKTHDVDLFWDDPSIVAKAQRRFGLDLSGVHVVPNIFATNKLFAKLSVTRTYDCIFMVTDGSIPTSLAKYNIVHFQVPFPMVVANPLALHRITHVVCNSEFTKKRIDPRMGKMAQVIYPPVFPIEAQPSKKKESLILSVGRFSSVHHMKKQDVMIDAFISMESRAPAWTLVLAGGVLESDKAYLSQVKEKAAGHRIHIQENITYEALQSLYKKASLYWHAAGFGETDPEYMEHFGMTTVEAASAGAVPLVFAAGGQEEIIQQGKNGILWKTPNELIDKTLDLIGSQKKYTMLQKNAQQIWKEYSQEKFTTSFDRLLASCT